jgi:plasmid stabilization system protein ParE
MQDAAQWWAVERSVDEANFWLGGLYERLQSLATAPRRCPLAAENEQFPFELRELYYGTGSRPTHRAIFIVAADLVLVLAVRHTGQDQLRIDNVIGE